MAAVILENIDKTFGDVLALHGVSIEVPDGSLTVFVGPSGCGKSTLLRSIAGLEGVDSGRILIGGRDVTRIEPAERDVAMVFQSYALYPHMSVRGNMEFGMRVGGIRPDDRKHRVAEAARILQLEELLERKPAQLSGGQRQRVAIGRAIVKHPQAFLFDEPLSNLDAKLRVQMRVELESLHKQLNATMIYVTHDQVEAMTMADRIVVLNEGRVEQTGEPMELYHRPASEFVAGFIGSPSMNFLEPGESCLESCTIHPDARKVGIRPEHIEIRTAEKGGSDMAVEVKEQLGGESYLYLKSNSGQRLVVKTDGDNTAKPGDTLGITIPPHRLHQFADGGKALRPTG